jgi:hypothetical protein
MATYLYKLRSNEGIQTFGSDNVKNWADIENNLARSATYKGITNKFTNTFQFTGQAKEYLKRLKTKHGVDADLFMTILVGNDNKERSSFVTLGDGQEYSGKLHDFNTVDTVIEINFENSGFQEKLFTRDGVKVNYDTYKSLDGEDIQPFDEELKKIQLHPRVLELKSLLSPDPFLVESSAIPSQDLNYYFAPNLQKKYASDESVTSTSHYPVDDENSADLFFLYKSDTDNKQVNINYDLTLPIEVLGSYPFQNIQLFRRVIDEAGNIKSNIVIQSESYDGTEGIRTFIYNNSEQLVLSLGDSVQLAFFVEYEDFSSTTSTALLDNDSRIDIVTIDTIPATEADFILPHELFTRLAQVCTGKQIPVYSELFGRTELGYAQDGEWAYLGVLTGLMLRGFPFGEYEEGGETKSNSLNISLKNAFKAYDSVLNLAAWIDNTGGNQVFRIEKYDELFDTSSVINLGNVISELSNYPDTKRQYTEVNVGYKDQEYEEKQGLSPFNGDFSFGIPMKVKDSVYDIISDIRADDIGIELARSEQYSDNPTKDTRYDKNIFFIDAKKLGNDIIAVRNEDYTSITNVQDPNSIYNARISPKRNLLRHGSIIKSALLEKPASELIYIKGANNPEMQSQLLTEVTPLVEKSNVQVSDLSNSKVMAEFVKFNAPFNKNQWFSVLENSNKMCKFVDNDLTIYGFIEDLTTNLNEETATITLRRATR